ncbi:MAG: hypothetical protein O7G30_18115 [Proteobacteria bacterium]|nr:hypothetical protein [Pseudomonadota bacterium]
MDRRRALRCALAFALAVSSAPTAAASGPTELVIEVTPPHLVRLWEQRDRDLGDAVPVAAQTDYLPATLRIGDRVLSAEIRLEGEYPDSSEGGKWPLRIKVDGKDHVAGIRRFGLHAPATRAFQLEPLVLRHLRREGVLAPRYEFVRVTINSEDRGVMALNELFSKELIESQKRREGVLLHFEEATQNGRAADARELFEGLFGASVEPFRRGHVSKSPRLTAELETARSLLRGFLQGELPADAAFDVELMARFLAVAEIWRATPMLSWRNVRLYFNPVSQRLEPIGYAADLRAPRLASGLATRSQDWSLVLLEDPGLRARFVQELGRIAAEVAAGGARGWIDEEEARHWAALRPEYPDLAAFDPAALEERAASLSELTELAYGQSGPHAPGADTPYPVPLRAYHKRDERGGYLELVNHLRHPIRVTRLTLTDVGSALVIPVEPLSPDSLPAELPPISDRGTPQRVRLYFAAPVEAPLDFRVGGVVAIAGGPGNDDGGSASVSFSAIPAAPAPRANPIPQASLDEVREGHPYLVWDSDSNLLRATPGVHRVSGSLVLPEGVGLELPAGTTLRFAPDAMLLATGPLHFEGTPTERVVLEGLAEGASPGVWQGVVVLHSDEPHHWSSVEVHNTSGILQGSWHLTAGVTIRDSEIEIEGALLRGNRSEDALNLIRSRFVFHDVSIQDTPSDAFDADFSDGEIRGGLYRNVGGDAIDISGADVVMDGVRLENVRDKAISVGEGSRLLARNLTIEDVGTALASKDGSVATLENSVVSGVQHTALMAYIKKPEYGPAELIARNVRMVGVERPAAAQVGSRVTIDGVEQRPEDLDVEEFYEHGHMKK